MTITHACSFRDGFVESLSPLDEPIAVELAECEVLADLSLGRVVVSLNGMCYLANR